MHNNVNALQVASEAGEMSATYTYCKLEPKDTYL